uniref:Uncharacterized protein n=1 Tax=Oryza barthii TaxID=65489 RepID=A0A0D3GQW2_9ORYZ
MALENILADRGRWRAHAPGGASVRARSCQRAGVGQWRGDKGEPTPIGSWTRAPPRGSNHMTGARDAFSKLDTSEHGTVNFSV